MRADVQSRHLTLWIDDEPVIDRWITTVPIATDGAALGLKEGTAWFANATIEKAEPVTSAPPVHRPDFAIRQWKNLRWGFDADEPLFVIGNDSNAYEVKLVRGYPGQLYVFWHWLNYSTEKFYANVLKEVHTPFEQI